MHVAALAVAAAMTLVACGSSSAGVAEQAEDPPSETTDAVPNDTQADEQAFPAVLGATASKDGDTWTISATLSSPYDSPERYADAWRVAGPDGTVYAERILTHDHASEQPFTRSQSGIVIPDDVTAVTIEGRDLVNGYGGATFDLTLPR